MPEPVKINKYFNLSSEQYKFLSPILKYYVRKDSLSSSNQFITNDYLQMYKTLQVNTSIFTF
jgi:hypothetical protein